MSRGMSGVMSRSIGSILLWLCLPALHAAGIDGTIVVKRRLTKRKVTLQAEDYSRGTAVELDGESAPNALAFEKAHVAIYLEGPLPLKAGVSSLAAAAHAAATPAPTMEQKNRGFVPDLLVIPAGSVVSFPNLDPIFHNVFSLSKPKSFDLGNYPLNQTRMVTFDKPGIVMVNCHLHPNMSATIVISPNGWATRSDADGHFSLADVPPGRYTVVAWHKTAGFFKQEVQVAADRGASVEFLIPLEAVGSEPVHGDPVHLSSHPVAHASADR
jgi:plastocyanin